MHPESSFWIAPNWPKIGKTAVTLQFPDMKSSSRFCDVVLILLSYLVTGPSFMPISLLVLVLFQTEYVISFLNLLFCYLRIKKV